jgi:uncharacterized protein YecE (DUF72 family)
VIVRIGTSGWQYRDWRPSFYPARLPQSHWLEAYAAGFATVESNNAFYRLPPGEVFHAWAERTPDDFVMAVKVSRFLTHVKRLAEPAEPVERFVSHARHLGTKLGPALLQLPPQLRADVGRLDAALEAFPRHIRVAVEFRRDSWFTADVRRVLERHGAALCLADRRGPRSPIWATTSWTYLRLHEGRATPRPCYGRAALAAWVGRLHDHVDEWNEAWVYTNNDHRACALANAIEFAGLAGRRDLEPTRVPPRSSVCVVGGR